MTETPRAAPLSTLLISDLHLSGEQPALLTAFHRFIDERASRSEALYILGDLFEAWIGDDDPTPWVRETIEALSRLSKSGTALYFIHGNRDFAIGRRFSQETGCQLLGEVHRAKLHGHNVLLLHGDTLCTGDVDYQRARRWIRNPLLLGIMKRLPLSTRQKIASLGRKQSIAATRDKSDAIMDVDQKTVCAVLSEYGLDTMIHGHTHRPADHHFEWSDNQVSQRGRRIVLGDWQAQGWYVEASREGLELLSFDISQ